VGESGKLRTGRRGDWGSLAKPLECEREVGGEEKESQRNSQKKREVDLGGLGSPEKKQKLTRQSCSKMETTRLEKADKLLWGGKKGYPYRA